MIVQFCNDWMCWFVRLVRGMAMPQPTANTLDKFSHAASAGMPRAATSVGLISSGITTTAKHIAVSMAVISSM